MKKQLSNGQKFYALFCALIGGLCIGLLAYGINISVALSVATFIIILYIKTE